MADLLYIKAKLLIQLISALLPFPKEEPAAKNIPLPAPKVLASTSVQDPFFFKVNVNSLFTAPATFQKPITAPNLITEDSAGTGINITEDETGFLTISGNQSGWGDIQVTGQTSLKPAKSGSALTLLGSGGISIATNTTDNKITISASSSDLNVSGWTDGGDYVYLKTEADKVGIGTASPSYKLHVSGTLGAESLTLTSNNLYSSGDLLIDPTGGAVKIGTGTPATLDLAGDDLYVTGDMEVAGTIYGTIDTSTGGLNTGFSSGSVIFQGDSGIEESADTFFWDNANKRLGIGTSTPTTTLEVDGNVTIRNTHSILPDTNLGSDLGSSSYRFNNLYVGNINSNSSASYTGQTTFTYEPTATTIAQTSVLLNPTAPTANSTLLGIAYAGYFRAGLDPEGDLILGYSGNIDSPTTNNPLDIYNHGTTRVGFATTAGDAYFAGKLGIGTTSPTKKFDVLGTARIAGELTIEYSSAGGDPRINSYIYVGGGNISMGGGSTNRYAYLKGLGIATSVNPVFSFHTDLNTGLGSAGDDILSLIAGGTNVLNANSSGNVGIGTTSPISKLHLYDSGVNTTLTLQATGAAGTIRNPIIDFYGNYNNENGSYLAGRIFTATAADGGSGRIIFAPSTSLTNTLTVAQTGGYPLVGIGTTTPDVPLHIQRIAVASGSTTIKDQRLFTMKFPTGAEYAQQADFWLGRHEESTSASRTAMTISLHHGATEPTTADTDVMTLLSSVRVGIGTTKPDNILHVAGSASTVKIDSSIDSVNGTSTIHLYGGNTNAYIKATGSNIGYGRELIFSGDANLRQIVLDMSANEQGTGNILFKTATVPTGAMVITKSGNVGIGTTSPGSLLSLNQTGDFKATPTISFGDGDSGIFQHQDDLIYFSSSGTLAGGFGSQGVFSIGNGFYYATLMSETPSATNPVIVPNNATPDADTGIGWAGADKLSLISGGVESLQINNANSYFASSNVGIGTTSPQSRFDLLGSVDQVQATIKANSTQNSDIFQVLDSSGNTTYFNINKAGKLGTSTIESAVAGQSNLSLTANGSGGSTLTLNTGSGVSTKIVFSINSIEAGRIDVNGNFGIGTTAPLSKMAIAGALAIGTTDSFANAIAPTSGLIVQGNVGIGTTSPTSKLYVAGEIKSPTINKVVVVDGVTYAQSCAGINSAIDALGADGGEIYLPQGTYTCAETVYIDNDYTTIRGAGNSTHINASALASGAVIDMYGADYVTIKNLKITGSAGGTAGNAIYTGPVKDDDTYGSDYFVVENVSIINSDDNGIYSRYSDSPIIKNCYIENADSTGIYIYDNGNGAIIEGNTITSSQGGIYFNAANRAIIKGNHLSNQLFGGGVEIGISDSDNTIIIGNTIANTSSIYQGISVTSSTYVTVSDNNITVGWIGIQIDSGSHYSTVSDNFLYGNSGRYGIWVQSNYNTISGNSVNHFVEDNPSYGKGIVIAGTDNVVMGNTLEGNTTALVDGGTNTQFLTPEDGKLAIGLDDTPDASLEIIKQSTFPILYLSSSINADGDLLTVSNDGNIGLGTTSPSSKLAVVGGVAIGTTDSFANAIAPTSGLIVQGNVGIGTTSPSYSLDILNNQNAATGINIKNGTDGASARSVLILDGSQNGHNGIIQFSNPSFNLGSTYGALRADALTLYTNNGAAGGISIVSTHASAPITFALGGYDDTDEKMRITSGGNVGIGTTIPTKGVLNVLGSVAIGSTAYTQVAGAAPSNGLIVEGNVGIGVSDPSTYKLVLGNVSTLANIPGIQFGTTMYFGTTSGYLNRIGLGPTNQTLLYNAGSNSAVTTGHIFSVDYATELMRIMGGPRVGIGTSLAGSTFSVAGSVSIGTTDSFANKAAPTSGLIVEGNVGIGTTIPSSKLHVAGGNIKLGNNYAILGSLSSTGEDREILNYNNGNNLYIGAGDANYVILGNVENRITMDNYSSNRYYMKFNTDSTERMRITNEGYLGIGTTLPGSTLAVVGGVAIGTTDSFANAAIAANNLAIQGDIGIGTTSPTMDLDIVNGVAYSRINAGDANFTASSSRDIKENFVEWDSTGILEKMTAIPVYTYDYIAGPKDRMGLIAEDFFTIFGRGSNKEINYQEVSMAMWLGIKELTKQLSEVQENMGITGATLSSPEVDMTATNSASLNTLTVSGVSTLGDTTVTGDLTAGLISINGLSSSINATGILKLQDMVLGEIDVMGGKIIFDTKGNIDMKQGVILGNSSFRGNIEIPANATDYTYSTTWDKAPESINITPSWNTNVWVDNISTSGFTIHFANPPTEAKKVFWNAIF